MQEMDELKLKITSKLMKNLLTKLISKTLFKKIGSEMDIQINDISIENVDGELSIHADIDGKMSKDEFIKLIKNINF